MFDKNKPLPGIVIAALIAAGVLVLYVLNLVRAGVISC
jgi:hypothetical protein